MGGETRARRVEMTLKPPEFAEEVEKEESCDGGDAADPLGAIGGFLEGQAFEVHAVDAGDGECWKDDGAEDGEHLHDFVGAVGDGREVDVEGVVEEVALGLYGVEQAGDVVVGVAD